MTHKFKTGWVNYAIMLSELSVGGREITGGLTKSDDAKKGATNFGQLPEEGENFGLPPKGGRKN